MFQCSGHSLLAEGWAVSHSLRKEVRPELVMGGLWMQSIVSKTFTILGWVGVERDGKHRYSFFIYIKNGASPFGERPRLCWFFLFPLNHVISFHNSVLFFFFFLRANIEVFHGLQEGQMCCSRSCSFTSCARASSFPWQRPLFNPKNFIGKPIKAGSIKI